MIPVTIRESLTGSLPSQEAKDEVLLFARTSVAQGKPADTWCLVHSGTAHYVTRTMDAKRHGQTILYVSNDADVAEFVQRIGTLFVTK